PARTGKALQHRSRSRLLVEMHRLRIELGGKGKRLLARDAARSESAEMADWEIFEGQHHHGDCGEEGPIVAALCGNLNRPACMARAPRAGTAARRPPPILPGATFGARPCGRFDASDIRLAGGERPMFE